jgi:HSP20 family protein
MQKAFKDLTMDNLKPGVVYTYGFNLRIEDDGTPHIGNVDDYHPRKPHPLMRYKEVGEEEPIFDCIEYFDSITITTEIFGVEKEDIQISVKKNKLVIDIDQEDWLCKQTIDLPCDVLPKSVKYTFNNGVLDINLKKKFLFNR